MLSRAGSIQRKQYGRRTPHRTSHQGRIGPPWAYHHLAGRATGLLAAKRLQDLQPQVDLHRLAPQNLRLAGLRFLQVLFGLEEREEKRVSFVEKCAVLGKSCTFAGRNQ